MDTERADEVDHSHAEQYLRQSEWLVYHQEYKEKLMQRGLYGFDLLEAMANLSLEHKISARCSSRCSRCWHPPSFCICKELKTLEAPEKLCNTKLIIWMHHKEYLSGGNSAKLMLSLLPKHTELFVFGKTGEMDRLEKELLVNPEGTAILWPSKDAVSVSEFLSEKRRNVSSRAQYSDSLLAMACPCRFLVVDGTYNMARNMYKSIRKRLGEDRMPRTVRVDPLSASIFHRAHKNYGQAHLQDTGEVRRVSTAEACGLLLSELSGDPFLEMRITEAVQANNRAIASSRGTLMDSGKG